LRRLKQNRRRAPPDIGDLPLGNSRNNKCLAKLEPRRSGALLSRSDNVPRCAHSSFGVAFDLLLIPDASAIALWRDNPVMSAYAGEGGHDTSTLPVGSISFSLLGDRFDLLTGLQKPPLGFM
jgi:hypothetical protein